MAIRMRRLTQAAFVSLVILLGAGCGGGTSVVTPAPTHTPTLPPSPAPTHTPTLPPSPAPTHTPTPLPSPTPTPTPTHTLTPPQFPPTSASPLGPWEPLLAEGLPGPWVSDIAFATPEVIFVVADGDVYRSDDGGAMWMESFNIYRMIQSVAVSPEFAADQTVFAVDGGSRLFRSTDGGVTWEEVTRIAQVGGASDVPVWLSISPAFPADPTLWANTSGTTHRSTDGGLAWGPFDPGVPLTEEMRLVPNPDYPADPTLEVLDYGTAEWSPLPDGLLSTPTLLVASGTTLLLGTQRGLYRSTDSGAAWREANTGLPPASVEPLTVASDGTIYAAVSRDPRLFRLLAGGARWEALASLPSSDPAGAWVVAMDAVVGADGSAALVIKTSDGLFVSRDGGVTWDRIEGAGLPAWYSLPLLSTDFAESGVACMVVEGVVYRTDDGGGSWAAVEGTSGVARLAEAPDRRLIGLAPGAVYEWDPALGPEWVRYPADFGERSSIVLKLLSARFATGLLGVVIVGGDVYLSEDGGRAWTVIGHCDLNRPPYQVSPCFDADHAIYAADDAMIYVSTDAGRTWIEAGEGLPVCEYAGPECGLELLWAERSDGGYNLYALVAQDFHSRIWVARAEEFE